MSTSSQPDTFNPRMLEAIRHDYLSMAVMDRPITNAHYRDMEDSFMAGISLFLQLHQGAERNLSRDDLNKFLTDLSEELNTYPTKYRL